MGEPFYITYDGQIWYNLGKRFGGIVMIYSIGYRDFTIQQGHKFIINKNITKEEYDNHISMIGEIKKLTSMKNIYNLMDRNGKEFLGYTSEIKKYLPVDNDLICFEANRLLINYLSSLSMFIDYGEKYNKKFFGKGKMKEFEEKTHYFYENHVSYRFMALMRNYALHYKFPLSIIQKNITGQNGIFASRELLLQFKAWKHAEEDIKKMPDLILLNPHVEISMMFIEHLYQDYIYDIAPVILESIEYINGMIKSSGDKEPILLESKNIEEFKNGNFSTKLLDLKSYYDALKTIESHPSINISYK